MLKVQKNGPTASYSDTVDKQNKNKSNNKKVKY